MKNYMKIAVAAMFLAAPQAGAEVLFCDSFDYAVGDLYSNGMWIRYGVTSSNPMQVVAPGLSYAGYEDVTQGNAVMLGNESGSESEQVLFRGENHDALSGSVYFSALISVDALPSLSKSAAFLCLTGANASDPAKFGDAVAGSEGGGLFAKAAETSGKYQLGVSRNVLKNGNTKSTVQWSGRELDVNETYLVVVKYEKIEGAANDKMWLWINPEKGDAEPACDVEALEADVDESLADIRGIELRQGSCPMAKIPKMTVDAVRVATSWNEIFSSGQIVEEMPVIKLSDSQLSFGRCYQGLSYRKTVNVKGQNLKGDIMVSGMESGELSVSDNVIPKDDAESEAGFDLEIELQVDDAGTNADKLLLGSADAQSKTLAVDWRPVETLPVPSLKELYDESGKDMSTVYRYTGDAVVTYIDSYYDKIQEAITNSIFVQDASAAVEIRSAAGCGYDEVDVAGVEIGDGLTCIIGNIIFSDDSGLYFIPVSESAWTVSSKGNVVQPEEMSFEQIRQSDPSDIMFRLVKVCNVGFDGKYGAAPDFYDKFNSQKYIVSDGTENGWLWAFNGADYKNQPTAGYFDKSWDLTGICYEILPQVTIAPRGFSDFVEHENGGVASAGPDCAEPAVVSVYDVYGRRVPASQSGIFIEKMSDGSARKVFRKK